MGETLSISSEDYLEAIYELSVQNPQVRNTDLALRMKVSKASVNKAVNVLCQKGYVYAQKYSQITLTRDGCIQAQRIIERHRTLVQFLTDHLGVCQEVAQIEACKMEHILSDDTILRIATHICGNEQCPAVVFTTMSAKPQIALSKDTKGNKV